MPKSFCVGEERVNIPRPGQRLATATHIQACMECFFFSTSEGTNVYMPGAI